MKSNVITAPIEYIHTSSHKWNIYSRESSSNAIKEYYLREEMARSQILDKAFSRHHAIVSSALDTAVKIVNRAFPKGLVVDTGRRGWVGVGVGVGVSNAYQKHHLVALSSMSGLLVTRLIVSGMTRCGSAHRDARDSHHHLMKTMKKYTQITTYYIHSALASEILIGNRYYRDILKHTASNRIIGHHGKQYTSEDITPALVNATKCELRRLYASQMVRLTDTVKQYKRGFVHLHEIQNDPEFQRLFAAFWQYSNQVMKKRDNYESSTLLQPDDDENDNRFTYYNKQETFNHLKQIKRFFVLSEISEVPAMVPRLYDYDIVHLFDSAAQGFVKYIQSVKNTLIRLANDGLTSAFLSFAAIEPGMVTPELAPAHGKTHQTLTLKSCANHIPSRDPLYGALRIQHRAHIPRTADVIVDARFDHDHDQYSDDIVRGLNGMSRFYAIQRIRELSLNTLVGTANRVV